VYNNPLQLIGKNFSKQLAGPVDKRPPIFKTRRTEKKSLFDTRKYKII